ncbi:hypothetical protein [Vreelandella lutescens]|uniref:Uncharacterized protein n=1 Tax=Vreelandella lutescens TaxID=1602943 RepID=A0ABQ1PMQ6_9GAMM|nr:hypothetical protein [Halomonas lutescens]GGC99759.1 hypothetical protein GCM10011382_32840 [Halomonas lutescens]
MSQNLLYLGPLRPETLTMLGELNPVDQAFFVAPIASVEQWKEVQGFFPDASLQISKVAEISGEKPYYEFNLPEFNASQPATGLYDLYPGLKLVDSAPDSLLGIDELLSEQHCSVLHTVIIEQVELVWPFLSLIKKSPNYKHVNGLWLRIGVMQLYKNTPELVEVIAWCEEEGFEICENANNDPDFPLLKFVRNPYFLDLKKSSLRVFELEEKIKSVRKDLLLSKNKIESITEEKKELREKQDSLYLEIDAIKTRNAALEKSLIEKDEVINGLKKKLISNQEIADLIKGVSNQLDKGFYDQKKYIASASSALGKHLTKFYKS